MDTGWKVSFLESDMTLDDAPGKEMKDLVCGWSKAARRAPLSMSSLMTSAIALEKALASSLANLCPPGALSALPRQPP